MTKVWKKLMCMCLMSSLCLGIQSLQAEEMQVAAMASSSSSHATAPFTELAVQTIRPTAFSFDSPLLRITGMYGVGHQAFLENIQDLELVAVTNHLLENPYNKTAPAALKNMSPFGYDPMQETQKQFQIHQQQYMTVMADPHMDREGMPMAVILAEAGGGIAMEDLPDIMEDEEVATFYGLNVNGKHQSHGHCACDCACDCCGCGSCGSSCSDDEECEEDSCGCGDEECEDDEECCCDCCCCEEEEGLLASGYYGYGAGGGGGGGGFGGGGGGSGSGSGSAEQTAQQEQEIIIPEVPIPEPSTYLLMAAMLMVAALIRRRQATQNMG